MAELPLFIVDCYQSLGIGRQAVQLQLLAIKGLQQLLANGYSTDMSK